ncbi:MAG: response regulator [Pseudomonadales bacterium]|nr:response regulator [Pseudomonadales bacterium]
MGIKAKFSASLSLKLILPVIFICLVFLLALIFTVNYIADKNLRLAAEKESFYIQQSVLTASDSGFTSDKTQKLLVSLGLSPTISTLRIVNTNTHTIIADNHWQFSGQNIFEIAEINPLFLYKKYQSQNQTVHSYAADEALFYSVINLNPVAAADNSAGPYALFLTLNMQRSIALLDQTLMYIILIGIGMLITAIFSVYWIQHRLIISPIQHVIETINTQKNSSDKMLMPLKSQDVGLLAKKYNDLSQRMRRYEQDLFLSQRALEAANNGLLICDMTQTDKPVIYANPEFERLSGYKKTDILGRNCSILQGIDTDERAIKNISQAIKKQLAIKVQILNYRKDGTTFWNELHLSPIFDQQGILAQYMGILVDVSDRVIQQKKLEEAVVAADTANNSKSEFLANMSHEIRTPMNAILGLSRLCLGSDLAPKQQDYLQKIYHSGESLLVIINDILDFSKIEAGKLQMENIPFELATVFDNLAMLTAETVQDKKLELIFDIRDEQRALQGDAQRLGQILLNLVSNAIKFTDQGQIIVTCASLPSSNNKTVLEFSVSDTGIGMTEKQCRGLFQPFHQADSSTTRRYGGTGLGLIICKNLVEMMNGSIKLESKPLEGTTIYFTAEFSRVARGLNKNNPKTFTLPAVEIFILDRDDRSRTIIRESFSPYCSYVQAMSSLAELLLLPETAENRLISIDANMIFDNGEFDSVLEKYSESVFLLRVSLDEQGLIEEKYRLHNNIITILKPLTPSLVYNAMLDIYADATSSALDDAATSEGGVGEVLENKDQSDPAVLHDVSVLLVEDNHLNQQIAMEFLEQLQCQVAIAANGQEALELLEIQQYDAILMDCQMPVMDGYEATRKIRAQVNLVDIPIIAMTANAMTGDKQKCLRAGMNDYISKPVQYERLEKILQYWIKKSLSKANKRSQNHAFLEETSPLVDALPDEIKGLDVAVGLKNVGGKKALYLRLLNIFYTEHCQDMQLLQDALQRQDYKNMQYINHTLKSLTATLGALQAHHFSESMELSLRDGNMDKVPQQLEDLSQEVQTLFESLAAIIPSA